MSRLITACLCLGALPASAADAGIEALYDALRLGDVIAVMQVEGLHYGVKLQADLFPGRGGRQWDGALDEIYATDRMEASMRIRLEEALAEVDVTPLVEFYTSERGAEIVALELEVRRAMQDEAVAEAAASRAADMRSDGTERMRQIDDLVESNGLIEENVVGALNASYAFYTGLAEGGRLFPDGRARTTCSPMSGRRSSRSAPIRSTGSTAISCSPTSRSPTTIWLPISRSVGPSRGGC